MTPSTADQSYMMRAAQGNLAEITAGNMAALKASNDMVKQFGTQMVTDHTNAQSMLQNVANTTTYVLPTEPDSAHKAMAAQMNMMSGRMFDSTYMWAQVADHSATITLLNDMKANSSMASLKNYATESLPTVMHHHHMADSMARTMFPQ